MPCRLYTDDYNAFASLPTATMDTFHRRMRLAMAEREQWERERDAEYDRQVALWRGQEALVA